MVNFDNLDKKCCPGNRKSCALLCGGLGLLLFEIHYRPTLSYPYENCWHGRLHNIRQRSGSYSFNKMANVTLADQATTT